MKNIKSGIVLIVLIIAASVKSFSQNNDRTLLRQVVRENQDAVNAIAMYPTETRKIIFLACEYPEVISKLNAMQKSTQQAFEKLVSVYGKEEQEKIWNLTRYTGLIAEIAAGNPKSEEQINNILLNYPDEIHKDAVYVALNHFDLLVQIANMNNNYDADFELLLSGYPPEAVEAFREMIKMPEVLNILFDHMQYTVVVGDYYKRNPDRVIHKTDSINQVLTLKNTQESEDWKQSIENDPQAQQEYTQAAKDYAQENGYQPEDYNTPLNTDVTNYNTNPYNWWFGYPTWYPYDYWNPYPYWYDWGFYYGPGHHVVFFGMPSAAFMDWYFYYPQHSYQYSELSNHYYNYYSRHRDSYNHNTISHSVNSWRNNNKNIVNDDWDKDNSNRSKRFKEYGQVETNRQKYNAKHPQKQLEQTEYIQKKQNKYPLISKDVSKNQFDKKDFNTKSIQENNNVPFKKPNVSVPDRYKMPVNQPNNTKLPAGNPQQHNINVQKPNENKQQQPVFTSPQQNKNIPVQPKQSENANQIRNAQQYHENTWKQIQPQSQPQQQRQQPQPQPQPQQQRQQPQQQQNISPPRQQENHQQTQPAKNNNPAPRK